MTYAEYCSMVVGMFPDKNYAGILATTAINRWNKIDLVKAVAKDLFMRRDVESVLANETIKQLEHLEEHGTHCFE